MVDGYRVMFAYRGESYFANLKAERSADNEYTLDRDNIVAELSYLSRKSVPLRRKLGPFDAYSIDKPSIDGSGPIGIYVLFKDATQTVVTIYFLNQHPDRRHFQTVEEYRTLRDAFLDEYVRCVETA